VSEQLIREPAVVGSGGFAITLSAGEASAMRLPRLRFTVRTLMLLVASVAVALFAKKPRRR
jgi:hypothetical protein